MTTAIMAMVRIYEKLNPPFSLLSSIRSLNFWTSILADVIVMPHLAHLSFFSYALMMILNIITKGMTPFSIQIAGCHVR